MVRLKGDKGLFTLTIQDDRTRHPSAAMPPRDLTPMSYTGTSPTVNRHEPIFDIHTDGASVVGRPVQRQPVSDAPLRDPFVTSSARPVGPAAWGAVAFVSMLLAAPVLFAMPGQRGLTPPSNLARTAAAQPDAFSIAVGEDSDPAVLWRRWAELGAGRSGPLAGLTADFRSVQSGGFRLSAGPFDTPAGAEEACGRVRTAGMACTVMSREPVRAARR
jgi:hypothetical protein